MLWNYFKLKNNFNVNSFTRFLHKTVYISKLGFQTLKKISMSFSHLCLKYMYIAMVFLKGHDNKMTVEIQIPHASAICYAILLQKQKI